MKKHLLHTSITTLNISTMFATSLITASCFKPSGNKNEDKKDDDQKIVDDFINKIDDTQSSKSSLMPSHLILSASPTQSELGINLISEEELSSASATMTITISSKSDNNGTIDVVIQIAKGSKRNSKNIQISGYKKLIKYEEEQIQKQIDKLKSFYYTSKSTILPSSFPSNGSTTTLLELGISISSSDIVDNVNLEYTIIDKNDSEGEITIEANASMTIASPKTKTITIYGYQSNNPDLNDVITVINQLQTNYSTTHTNSLASAIGAVNDIKSENDLGIDLSISNSLQTSIELKINAIDVADGIITISAKVSKNNKERTKLFTISGYKSQNLIDVDAIINQFSSTDTTKTNSLPSSIGNIDSIVSTNTLGISQPSSLNGVSLEIKIKQVNNVGGWLEVEIKGTKGSASNTKNIIISNYRNQATQDILDVSSLIVNVNTTKNTLLPSSIGAVGATISNSLLGISNPSDIKGTTISYKIKSFSDTNGTLVATVTISKNTGTSITKDITISGYRTTAQDITDIDSVLTTISNKTTTKTSSLASSISSAQSVVTETELGIAQITNTLGVTISLKTKSINDDTGHIIVTATASKNGQSKTKDFIVSGFKASSFITGDITTASNAGIKSSYFATTKMNLNDSRFNFSNGSTFNSYIIELNNGTKFVFETGNSGLPGFFEGYTFDAQNEDSVIKAHLYNYVDDAVKQINTGHTLSLGLEIVYSPFAPGNEGTLGTTNTSLWGFNQIWMNYSFWDLRHFSSLRKNTEWGFQNKVNQLLGHHRNYWESISTLGHEMGHMEIDSALGNFFDDDYAIRAASRTLDGVSKNYGATFKNTSKGFNGATIATDLITLFQKYGVDLSSVLGNMNESSGKWESTNNAGLSFNQATIANADSYIQAIYGKDIKQSLGEAYDASYSTDTWNKINLSNQNVKWTYQGGGTQGETNYSTGREWFINAGYNSFLEKHGKWGNSNTTYVFEMSEFLTRMNGILTGSALRNGADIYAESLATMYSNAVYSNPWSSNPLDANGSSTTNGTNLANYVNNNTDRIANRTLRDSLGAEIFHFASRIGHENVSKILDNREEILVEFMNIIYGGGEKASFANRNPVRDSSGYKILDNLTIKGVTRTKNIKFNFGLRKDINNLNEYIVPENSYKNIVWKSGHNKISTGLYYYSINLPTGFALSDILVYQNTFLNSNPSLMPNYEPIIKINNGSFTSNFSWFHNVGVETNLSRISYGTTGTNRLTFPQIMNDPSSNSIIYIPMFKE